MALIVGGTTVTGTQTLQASTLTGTASAINGSNITSLPAPSTANVASATAGVGVGDVGSYATINSVGSSGDPGATSSSDIRYSSTGGQIYHTSYPSGTWRVMGKWHSNFKTSNCLRIS